MNLIATKETSVTYITRSRPHLALAGCLALLIGTMLLVSFLLPSWAYPLWNPGIAVAVLALGLASGVRPSAMGLNLSRRGLMVAGVGAALVAIGYAVGWVLPATRIAFHDSRVAGMTLGGVLWAALVRVPLGTVLLEEVAFRGVLPALLGGDRTQWRWKPVLGASGLFGLWHLFPALHLAHRNQGVHAVLGSAGSVIAPAAAMLAAMGAGIFLCAWRHLGRGLLAPLAFHTATNSGGYLLAWLT